jgi:hypothetical protein
MHKLHEWKVLWQRFWLDLCSKRVVSARACTYQSLPYSSSSSTLFVWLARTVHTVALYINSRPLYMYGHTDTDTVGNFHIQTYGTIYTVYHMNTVFPYVRFGPTLWIWQGWTCISSSNAPSTKYGYQYLFQCELCIRRPGALPTVLALNLWNWSAKILISQKLKSQGR